MKQLQFGLFFIIFCIMQSVVKADSEKKYYYSVAKYSFDFYTNNAVLHEYYIDFRNKRAVTSKIISVNFTAKTFELIASSVDALSPLSIDPSQKYVMYDDQSKKRVVLFDLIGNEVINTKSGGGRLVQWNEETESFYLMVDDPRKSSYKYNLKDNVFTNTDHFEYATNRDSDGDYRLEYFADDMDSIWTVVEKKTDKKLMSISQSNGYNMQELVWNEPLNVFWFYPHSKLVDIDKRETKDFLEEKRWNDIAHDGRFIFLHDQKNDSFHVVNAFTGEQIRSFTPFWRQSLSNKNDK